MHLSPFSLAFVADPSQYMCRVLFWDSFFKNVICCHHLFFFYYSFFFFFNFCTGELISTFCEFLSFPCRKCRLLRCDFYIATRTEKNVILSQQRLVIWDFSIATTTEKNVILSQQKLLRCDFYCFFPFIPATINILYTVVRRWYINVTVVKLSLLQVSQWHISH